MVEIKRSYESADDAVAALDEKVRAHCKRVEDYSAVLFNEAVAKELYCDKDAKAKVRFVEEYLPLMRKAAFYHDIGKAFVPAFYQRQRRDFDETEQIIYRKHVEGIDRFIDLLFTEEETYSSNERKYVREAIVAHHENWDGSGYPAGLKGKEISVYARIIRFADVFDHLSAETVSEDPFDYAWNKVQELFGSELDPGMKDMISGARTKLNRVYKIHIAETKSVPSAPTFVERRASRPLSLYYRPIKTRKTDKLVAFQAELRFKKKHELETIDKVDHLLKREKLYQPLGKYMIYEACDTIARIDRCGLHTDYIAIELPNGWFNRKGAHKIIFDALREVMVDAHRLAFIVTPAEVGAKLITFTQNVERLSDVGVKFICCGVYPQLPDIMDLSDARVSAIMIDKESSDWLKSEEASDYLGLLKGQNISVIAEDMATDDNIRDLDFFDVDLVTGNSIGEYKSEDALISEGLALINEQQD